MLRPWRPQGREESEAQMGDALLERMVRLCGVDVGEVRRIAPRVLRIADAASAAAEAFVERMKS